MSRLPSFLDSKSSFKIQVRKGSEVLGSAPPPAKKTAGLIEKETDEKSNDE